MGMRLNVLETSRFANKVSIADAGADVSPESCHNKVVFPQTRPECLLLRGLAAPTHHRPSAGFTHQTTPRTLRVVISASVCSRRVTKTILRCFKMENKKSIIREINQNVLYTNLCNITSTNDFYIFSSLKVISSSLYLHFSFIFIILILFLRRRSFVRLRFSSYNL